MTAIQAGFTSVMMDGSLKADGKTPGDWDYNVGVTRTVTDMAHLGGISVEGELGVLGSLETGMGDKEVGHGAEGKLSHDQLLTNPDEAVKFVKETKVDALAIAMGTSHGAYKFTRKPDGDILAMNVIEEIHRKLPNMHLVMHGSSSVPQELQEIINAFGGKMPQTWGVPVAEIQRGIKNGVRKINIDTDNRMAMTGQIRRVLQETPGEFDPRKYLKPAMEAMASASTLVSLTNFTASSGLVRSWSWLSVPSAPWPSSLSPLPVSSEPSTPSSPSTEMPPRCAMSVTALVTPTL
jgi:fructose-bisphosphate aldolase class II